jgi:four helix bundle protein
VPGSLKSYRDLQVWQEAMPLAKDIYQATASFPSEERFGIVNQIRRSAVAIPSNIAEGHARHGRAEFRHYISIAMGSIAELETQLILSKELGYAAGTAVDDFLRRLDVIGKMLRGLQKSLGD